MSREIAPVPHANTLALRCTPELVADSSVYLREFDDDTRNAWFALQKQTRRGGPEQIPYSIATTALRVLTGGYVHLDKYFRFLASKEPLPDRILRRMFTYLEGFALGKAIDDIAPDAPPDLAMRVSGTSEKQRFLAEYLTPRPGRQPVTPNWVYETVAWDLASQLAERPLVINELQPVRRPGKDGKVRTIDWEPGKPREIDYLPDSSGDLIAWQHPFGRLYNDTDNTIDREHPTPRDAQYALSRISLTMKTLPNITSPVLLLDSHVCRIYSNLVYAKTALVEQPKPGLPLLRVSLTGGGGMRTVNRLALQVLSALKMDDTPLREIEQRSATERQTVKTAKEKDEKPNFITPPPGLVRPIMPKNYQFAVGNGAGIHHLRLLATHIDTVFGSRATHLEMPQVTMGFTTRPTDPLRKKEKESREQAGLSTDTLGFPPVDDVHKSITAAGFEQLRILCLYYRDETRLRMINCLAKAYALEPGKLDPAEDVVAPLSARVSAVFYNATAFLEHGETNNRREHAKLFAKHLPGNDSVMVAAFCETEHPDKPEKRKGDTASSLALRIEKADAKFQTKRFLSGIDVTTQYLVGKERGKFNKPGKVIQPSDKDHPAYMALCDLYRALGIVDQRIERALVADDEGRGLPPIAYCGVHVRKQAGITSKFDEPRRIILASALVPPTEVGGTWTMLGWTSIDQQWQPYRQANNTFHAHSYPEHRRGTGKKEADRWAEAGQDIDQALAELSDYLDGEPYAVMIDGNACRRIWPGLQNQNLDRDPAAGEQRVWLPGASIDVHKRPSAIIRINIKSDEVPQPVSITQVNKDGTSKESRTSPKLYKLSPDFGTPTWMLFNVPRNYDGSGGGRLGSTRTRWDAPLGEAGEKAADRRKNELKAPWYTMTATEIHPFVLRPEIDAEALAIATARLCHQTIAWSDRSRYPAPLHAAKQMDLDHPEYRRSAPPEDLPQSEEEEFEDE
ncbi:RNaseH domain-containing protein [Nonomuraea deserti]|nr:RNaseH domain-containing protein [Nonomuraea deserti]